MDSSRRKFMKGMVSVSLVGGALSIPGGSLLFDNAHNKDLINSNRANFDPQAFNFNYGAPELAAIGTVASSFLLNNFENLYMFMIVLIAASVFYLFGLPGLESLFLPGTEQIITQ